MRATASQFWFLAFALATAASVRTLALAEVLFAQAISAFIFKQATSAREGIGMAMIVIGVSRRWLPVWRVTRTRDRRGLSRGRHRRRPAEASSPDDFLADEVEPDDPRNLALVEVAVNRVSDLVMEIGQVVGLGEDRLSEGPSGEASLGGFLDEEDHFRQIRVLGW